MIGELLRIVVVVMALKRARRSDPPQPVGEDGFEPERDDDAGSYEDHFHHSTDDDED